MKADLYAALGVPRDAGPDEIKRAHRRKAKETHPDVEGGDATAFHAAQKAYAVLISPEKRAKYDATGDFDEGADNAHVEALTIIRQMMDQIVGQVGDRFEIDIVAKMREAMDDRIAAIHSDMAKMRSAAERLAKLGKRFRCKRGHQNMLRGIVDAKRRAVEDSLASGERAIAAISKARAMLDIYSFDVDEPAPEMHWFRVDLAGGASTSATVG